MINMPLSNYMAVLDLCVTKTIFMGLAHSSPVKKQKMKLHKCIVFVFVLFCFLSFFNLDMTLEFIWEVALAANENRHVCR